MLRVIQPRSPSPIRISEQTLKLGVSPSVRMVREAEGTILEGTSEIGARLAPDLRFRVIMNVTQASGVLPVALPTGHAVGLSLRGDSGDATSTRCES